MRHAPVLALSLAAALLAGCATPDGTPRKAQAAPVILQPAECLDPAQARSWDSIDGYTLLVDGGRRKYRIELYENCVSLGSSITLGLRGDFVSNRVCGRAGDVVLVGRERCRIRSAQVIDKETYDQLRGASRARGEVQAGAGL